MNRRRESVALAEAEEAELKRRGYIVHTTLGKGSFSKVKRADCTRTNRSVALKIINQKKVSKNYKDKFLPRELEILRDLDHPYVVKVYEIFEINEKVIIAMELAPHGDLLDYVKLRGPLKESHALFIFRQIVGAVRYLHKNNIAHRDLKCENILLDHQNNIKVNDFGFARTFDTSEKSETYCGTAAYTPPEVLMGITYEPKRHDVWALGVILYIMVCATFPYNDKNIAQMVNDQRANKVFFYKCRPVSKPCKQLIRSVLESDLKKRLTLSRIVIHPWMKKDTCEKESGKPRNTSDSTGHDVALKGQSLEGALEGVEDKVPTEAATVIATAEKSPTAPEKAKNDAVPPTGEQPNVVATLMPEAGLNRGVSKTNVRKLDA